MSSKKQSHRENKLDGSFFFILLANISKFTVGFQPFSCLCVLHQTSGFKPAKQIVARV